MLGDGGEQIESISYTQLRHISADQKKLLPGQSGNKG